ncbi:MAG: hypothetical protein HC921_01100 [Synechococcaceae cyanobacterium SM2_3_1]|nr:hypothetical protein [Synechococcaceae cyanobacterium SM2_3_1]
MAEILSPEELSQILTLADQGEFIDGKLTAGWYAQMAYGSHVDNAVMTCEGQPIRTDLSFTLFLSSPDSYEGAVCGGQLDAKL